MGKESKKARRNGAGDFDPSLLSSKETALKIRKADILLGIFLALLCAATCWYVYSSGSGGAFAVVSVDGEEYGTYSLEKEQVIHVDSEYGHNTLTVEKGRIRMTEADCPDGYCMGQYKKSGGIDSSNQTIICLPNRVSVSIKAKNRGGTEAGSSEGPDAVTGVKGR